MGRQIHSMGRLIAHREFNHRAPQSHHSTPHPQRHQPTWVIAKGIVEGPDRGRPHKHAAVLSTDKVGATSNAAVVAPLGVNELDPDPGARRKVGRAHIPWKS